MADIYTTRANTAKALAHPTRLRILDLLCDEEEICVCHIGERLEEGQPTISKHLAILKDAGFVASRKDGLMVFYRLRTPCVQSFFSCLDQVLATHIQAQQTVLPTGEQFDE